MTNKQKLEEEFRKLFQSVEGGGKVLESGIAKWFIDKQLQFISQNFIPKAEHKEIVKEIEERLENIQLEHLRLDQMDRLDT